MRSQALPSSQGGLSGLGMGFQDLGLGTQGGGGLVGAGFGGMGDFSQGLLGADELMGMGRGGAQSQYDTLLSQGVDGFGDLGGLGMGMGMAGGTQAASFVDPATGELLFGERLN